MAFKYMTALNCEYPRGANIAYKTSSIKTMDQAGHVKKIIC